MPQIDLSILNQRQTPAFYADVLANRPAAGFIGRIFVSTDTYEFYRDNGTTWDIVGGPGSGTVTGSGSLFRVAIWNSTSSIGESNNLIFDYSTNRLGIGTNTPGASLDVHSAASSIAQFNQTTATNNSLLVLQNSGSALWRIGNYYNAGANDFGVFDVIGAQQPLTIKKTTGQVLIGTSTVGSGKLVVSSATSDNGIQIAGANAPSLRIDNAESGPTKRAGLGISTAVNNFIQGSADRDFCIFNGSTAAASPILFGVYDTGLTNVQEAARISAARNFLIGTTTDAGFKIDVNGTGRIQNFATITHSKTNTQGVLEVYNTTSSNPNSNSINVLAPNMPNASLFGIIYGGKALSTNNGFGINYNHISDGAAGNYVSYNFFGVSNIMRMYASGNTTIGGATTDAGFKLDVNGSTRVNGSFDVSGTLSMTSTNQRLIFNNSTSTGGLMGFASTLRISGPGGGTQTNYTSIALFCAGDIGSGNTTATSGTGTIVGIGSNGAGQQLAMSSGNFTYNALSIGTGINTTGTYSGIIRGLLFNPFIVSTTGADIRAIETVIGNVCLGTTSGNVLIGTATSGASKLRIVGLPTSAAGLSSGDVYSNLGVLTIVP